jgi:hypothetical protein
VIKVFIPVEGKPFRDEITVHVSHNAVEEE